MLSLESRALTLGYDKSIVIEELDLAIPKGTVTVLIGSNGCGKSTLLRALARLLKPISGEIFLADELLSHIPGSEVAKRLSILPQGPNAPEEITVYQLVKQGRYPYQSWFRSWSEDDERMVERALAATGLSSLRYRPLQNLSGGQRQRAWIALILAQNTDIILLDEPTTYLDLSHQIEVLELLQEQNETANKTIVMVLHDLYLACRYADHLVTLKNGQIYAQGKPQDIVTTDMVRAVFGLDCHIIQDPITDTPICIPHGRKTTGQEQRNHDAP